MMLFDKFDENKDKFYSFYSSKDPTIEFSKHIEFDKITQNKKKNLSFHHTIQKCRK